ncbi:MAG: ABC-ATPase UvrA, partial [Lachnospiraceae bacterium]|nr:ABC-ATPase UvrA [Lachnospiraceae bacterium]
MTQKNKTTSKQSARKILPADIHDYIRVRGAAENNLKHISVNIPRQTLTVLTGLSGSGKSSLAFNTIFAEGQRRYMESLSSYARMFLGQMEKPNVENIEGLSPTISIDQKTTNRNPRSTVGTVTEIYDHFRLLYARIGIPHCPNCGREIRRQSVDEMADQILQLETGTKLQILAPVVRGKKGRHEKVFERAKRAGYVRVRVDGSQYDLSEEIELDKNIKHSIEIIVDRLVIKEDRQSMRSRLTDSIESALALAAGLLVVDVIGGKELTFSQSFSCPDCGISIPEIEPRSFSFNNPYGACPECSGLGYKMEFDEDLMVPDQRLSLNEGAIQVMGWQSSAKEGSFSHALLEALAKTYHFSLDEPYEKLPQKIRTMLMHGFDKTVTVHYVGQRGEGNYPILFDGLIKNVEQRYRETGSDAAKAEYEEFMRITPCKA